MGRLKGSKNYDYGTTKTLDAVIKVEKLNGKVAVIMPDHLWLEFIHGLKKKIKEHQELIDLIKEGLKN